MKRRELLKTGCAATATGSLVGLGGCIGGDGGDDGNDDESSDGGDSTDGGGGGDGGTDDGSDGDASTDGDSDTGDEEAQYTIEELEIVDTQGSLKEGDSLISEGAERGYVVTATIANNGEKTTDLMNYGYEVTLYDADGAEIDPFSPGVGTINGSQIDPGEEGTIGLQHNLTKYEPEVADHDVRITCDSFGVDDPAYCSDDDYDTGMEDGPGQPDWDSAASGSVRKNIVSQLEITGLEADRQGGAFFVRPTIQNNGDQMTDLFEYNYELALFETSGAEMPSGSPTLSATGETDIPPGESGQFMMILNITKHYPEVGNYELTLNCESVFDDEKADGVYCG